MQLAWQYLVCLPPYIHECIVCAEFKLSNKTAYFAHLTCVYMMGVQAWQAELMYSQTQVGAYGMDGHTLK
jgi:hypothetical protein